MKSKAKSNDSENILAGDGDTGNGAATPAPVVRDIEPIDPSISMADLLRGDFEWSEPKWAAAIALADGHTIAHAAAKAGVTSRTVQNWKANYTFIGQVNGMALERGMALRGERVRLAKRAIRKRGAFSKRDLIDWLKYVQGEMDANDLASQLADAQERLAELEKRVLDNDR